MEGTLNGYGILRNLGFIFTYYLRGFCLGRFNQEQPRPLREITKEGSRGNLGSPRIDEDTTTHSRRDTTTNSFASLKHTPTKTGVIGGEFLKIPILRWGL